MKKALTITILLGTLFWAGGCMAVAYEQRRYGPRHRPRIAPPPVVEVVEVVEVVPPPPPRRRPRIVPPPVVEIVEVVPPPRRRRGPYRAPHPVPPPHWRHRPHHR